MSRPAVKRETSSHQKSGPGFVVRVFPSRAALNQRLQADLLTSPDLVLLRPQYFTFEEFLPGLLSQVSLPAGYQALEPWSGPFLVHELISRFQAESGPFSGIALGRRLPDRLWRLLVEIKAAGLRPADIEALQVSEHAKPLVWLLAEYNQALNRLHLMDQADLLELFEARLDDGQNAIPQLKRWAKVIAQDVLWLRSLDLRLLKALSHLLPVEVRFGITPKSGDSLFKLLHASAGYLESEAQGDLRVVWQDIEPDSGPLSNLMNTALSHPGGDYLCPGSDRLRLERCAGRYSEVERLVYEALRLVESGVDPGSIGLIFPDLSVYGQMAVDVAARIGLPISGSGQNMLNESPLVQAVISQLQLFLGDMPAPELCQVLESPYLDISGWLLGPGDYPAMDQASLLLSLAGYVDGREGIPESRFEFAAQKHSNHKQELLFLPRLLVRLKQKAERYSHKNNISGYLDLVLSLLDQLDFNCAPNRARANPCGDFIGPERLRTREIMALAGFRQALAGMSLAADQVQAGAMLSAGRCLALLRQVLAQTPGPSAGSARQGVLLLRMEQAAGLKLHTALVGGLSQSAFPVRPQSQHMLNSQDRLILGRNATMPVWRTDEEEYSGQLLNLARIIANTKSGAWLTCPASGPDGKESEPSFWFSDLARGLQREITRPQSGAFGSLPALADCRDKVNLWAGLSKAAHHPAGPDEQILAGALLKRLEFQGMQHLWSGLERRAGVESKRIGLDRLGPDQRPAASDQHGGRITSPQALGLLKQAMRRPPFTSISATSLESLAACPMHWFFTRLLGLAETELMGWEISAAAEGEWVHETMARFFEPAEYADNWSPEQVRQRLFRCLQEAKEHLLQKGGMGHPMLWEGRQPVLETGLLRVAQSELESMPPARPWAVEKRFGGAKADIRIVASLAGGDELELVGRLDRLDAASGLLRITDYKHGKNTAYYNNAVDEEAQGKTAFQLALYMAASVALHGLSGGECTARLVPTRLADRKPGMIHYAADDIFLAAADTAGATAENNLFAAISALWERTRCGDLAPRPDKDTCRYCPVQGVCRAEATVQALGDSA